MAKKKKKEKIGLIEGWLLFVADHLGKAQHRIETTYLDRYQGDQLAVTTTSSDGVVELQIVRRKNAADMLMLASGVEALTRFVRDIEGLHKNTRWRDALKRGFIRRIERMAAHLAATFQLRQQSYPGATLDRFRLLIADAQPATGVFVKQGKRGVEKEATPLSESEVGKEVAAKSNRYHTRHAAYVPIYGAGRMAVYLPDEQKFWVRAYAGQHVAAKLRERGGQPLDFAFLFKLSTKLVRRQVQTDSGDASCYGYEEDLFNWNVDSGGNVHFGVDLVQDGVPERTCECFECGFGDMFNCLSDFSCGCDP